MEEATPERGLGGKEVRQGLQVPPAPGLLGWAGHSEDVGPPRAGSLLSAQEDLVSMQLREEINTNPLLCKCQARRGLDSRQL